jgi:hypothetical protein
VKELEYVEEAKKENSRTRPAITYERKKQKQIKYEEKKIQQLKEEKKKEEIPKVKIEKPLTIIKTVGKPIVIEKKVEGKIYTLEDICKPKIKVERRKKFTEEIDVGLSKQRNKSMKILSKIEA